MTFSVQAPRIRGTGPLADEIDRLAPWFHNIHLPTGEQTAPVHPLGDFPRFKWRQIAPHIPDDLTGRTALDIGCNAGFYSIELARRGAAVTAIDHDEHYLRQARWAAEQFGVHRSIDFRKLGLYDLAGPLPGAPDTFDIVIFMGVLYHLRHPLLGLEVAAARAHGTFVFQTLTFPEDQTQDTPEDLSIEDRERLAQPGWPRMAFVEHRLASDPTNWWVPNASCCEAMLRAVGMQTVARPGHELYICRPHDGRAPALSQETRDILAVVRPAAPPPHPPSHLNGR